MSNVQAIADRFEIEALRGAPPVLRALSVPTAADSGMVGCRHETEDPATLGVPPADRRDSSTRRLLLASG
jgi:hypothetical protein